MTKSTTIKGAEVTVCGCTFIVNYRHTPAIPATHWQPSDPAEVEILRVEIKGQHDSGYAADELLEAIKIDITCSYREEIEFDNGYDLLQAEILKAHQQ